MRRLLIAKASLPVSSLAGVVVALLSGCAKEKEAAAPPPPEVEVVTIEQKDVPIYRDWVGSLDGDVNAAISAQVAGYLLKRNYEEGRFVKQGDLLFEIDERPFQAALDQANAKLRKTELDVQRYTPLAATEAISKQELDNAIQANLAAKAVVEEAKLNLQFCKIISPIDGVAGLAKAQVGNLVGPSTGLLTTVTKIDPIRVYFAVDQVLLSQIQQQMLAEGRMLRNGADQGQSRPLELMLASGALYPEKGKVRFADNQLDVKTGTIRVVGEFPNPQAILVPGMFTRVRALLGTHTNALLVPQRAITDMQGRSLIAVVGADNKVSIRPVKTGERLAGSWVIEGEIKAGDKVVAEGVQKVREGAEVKPIPFAPPAPATTSVAPVAQSEEARPTGR
jgi:membrane fusion protein (multidrug efflux system)